MSSPTFSQGNTFGTMDFRSAKLAKVGGLLAAKTRLRLKLEAGVDPTGRISAGS